MTDFHLSPISSSRLATFGCTLKKMCVNHRRQYRLKMQSPPGEQRHPRPTGGGKTVLICTCSPTWRPFCSLSTRSNPASLSDCSHPDDAALTFWQFSPFPLTSTHLFCHFASKKPVFPVTNAFNIACFQDCTKLLNELRWHTGLGKSHKYSFCTIW